MLINALPLLRHADFEAIKKTTYVFQATIFKIPGNIFTWRGQNQYLPNGSMLVATVDIVFAGDSDMGDEWPLEIEPVGVILDSRYFGESEWAELKFDNHHVAWTSDGNGHIYAAQFYRAK